MATICRQSLKNRSSVSIGHVSPCLTKSEVRDLEYKKSIRFQAETRRFPCDQLRFPNHLSCLNFFLNNRNAITLSWLYMSAKNIVYKFNILVERLVYRELSISVNMISTWDNETLSEDWGMAYVCPIHKKMRQTST